MCRIGVILAAGRGTRMGGTKQLATWKTANGGKPLVAAAYDAILPICDRMIVVLGHEADAVAAALCERHFQRVYVEPNQPMFESIRAGLRAVHARDSTAAAVLQPGDHPEVATATLESLCNRSLKRPVRAIVPEYRGRGGHPVMIPPEVVALLLDAQCPAGLGEFWAKHPQLCHRVPVDDPAVVRDVDTREDLAG
jgi:molybdenum cofactor cytidylyltransferase